MNSFITRNKIKDYWRKQDTVIVSEGHVLIGVFAYLTSFKNTNPQRFRIAAPCSFIHLSHLLLTYFVQNVPLTPCIHF